MSYGPNETTPSPPLPPWEWTWHRTVLAIILTPIVLGAIFGNLLVLISFFTKRRDMKLPTHIFIANLALADGLVGVLAMPFLATVTVTERWYFGTGYCSAWIIIHFWLCSASILSTCAICIERYIGVKYPLEHLTILSMRRVIFMVVGVWCLAGAMTLSSVYIWPEPLPEVPNPYECRINQQIGHVIVVTVGVLYIPAAIMVVLYWRIYVIAVSHMRLVKKTRMGEAKGITNEAYSSGSTSTSVTQETSFESTDDNIGHAQNNEQAEKGTSKMRKEKDFQSKSKKEINLAKKLSILVSVLLISYIPFFTVFLIRAFNPNATSLGFFLILGWIRYSNSCINPIIYGFAVPAYRKAFKSILTSWTWKST